MEALARREGLSPACVISDILQNIIGPVYIEGLRIKTAAGPLQVVVVLLRPRIISFYCDVSDLGTLLSLRICFRVQSEYYSVYGIDCNNGGFWERPV